MPVSLTVKVGESVPIDNGRITVTLDKTIGKSRASLSINAPDDVHIGRPSELTSQNQYKKQSVIGKDLALPPRA